MGSISALETVLTDMVTNRWVMDAFSGGRLGSHHSANNNKPDYQEQANK